jgi:hypothetical protein
MVRGNGSARAETSVKAAARPNTIRITMRRGPLRDTLDDDLSTITIPEFITYIALALERCFLLARDAQRKQAILSEGSKCQTLTTSSSYKTKIAIHPPGISTSPREVAQTGMRIQHQYRGKKKGLAAGGSTTCSSSRIR